MTQPQRDDERVPIKIHRGGRVHYLGTATRREASRLREAARRQYDQTGQVEARAEYAARRGATRETPCDGDARLWMWSHFLAGRELTPEQRLMLSVVEDARAQLNARSAAQRREARRWFMSNDRSYLHAFVTICDAFDVDPVAARRGLFGDE